MAVEFVKDRKWQDEDFTPYIGRLGNEKLLPLPNVEDLDPLQFLNNLAAIGHMLQAKWGYARLPVEARNQWTQFFLSNDGSGYAVTYGGERRIEDKSYATPIVRHFAICKHKVIDGPGANHNRGWHPGHCELCGMDTSYDSGD